MKLRLVLLLIAVSAMPLRADVLLLPADKDTMIQNGFQDNADGGGAGLFAGTNGNGSPHRILISFSLNGIPSGATITDVQLTLTLGQVAGQGMVGGDSPTSATISMFDITRSWGEGTAGDNTMSNGLGASGGGYPAATGDATWKSAFHGQSLWTVAGGDHASTPSATLVLDGNATGTPFTWLSTPQLVADVQGWLDHPSTNFGWEMINANEKSLRTLYGFYSSEWHTFPTGLASEEPALQVTFTVPEPAAASLAALAALAIFCLRPSRRRV